ncbi:uncharacterized protein LOC119559632 isoform X1 [Drosophila subpulchrella]|uniref:uncharacterized protein LOC119559632 isoform X1 n=2 Tax=Drosophila subpulchrella TaxID=1486046 RepID=UPI0018A18528|nr:uncharacterized protein LOC119559632 isoform X1 [Drosophila subpulchrella]
MISPLRLKNWPRKRVQASVVEMESQLLRANNVLGKVTTLEFQQVRSAWPFNDLANSLFKENVRLSRNAFNVLVQSLPGLAKDTNWRLSIPLEKRIAISLFTMGSSAEFRIVERLFGVSPSTICGILHEFCNEAWRKLAPKYLPAAFLAQENVENNVAGFHALGFPHRFGAIDRCHIEISPPKNYAVDFYNYMELYSVILLALVDHRYQFRYVWRCWCSRQV